MKNKISLLLIPVHGECGIYSPSLGRSQRRSVANHWLPALQFRVSLAGRLLAALVVGGIMLSFASQAAMSYLDNGVVKVGIDTTKGGSITYLSVSGTTNNVINSSDLGREVQQSYYSGPNPYNPSNNINPSWNPWPWNPIQSGDSYGNASRVLTNSNNGQTIYVKCIPHAVGA